MIAPSPQSHIWGAIVARLADVHTLQRTHNGEIFGAAGPNNQEKSSKGETSRPVIVDAQAESHAVPATHAIFRRPLYATKKNTQTPTTANTINDTVNFQIIPQSINYA